MDKLIINQLRLKSAMVNVNGAIVYSEATKEALVVDPGNEPDKICTLIAEKGLKLKYIVMTHGHFDHIMCGAELKRRTGAPICMNKEDEFFIRDSEYNAVNFSKIDPIEPFDVDIYLKEGDKLNLGGCCLTVLDTPGHTPGEISLYTPGHLICGDTILKGTTGRMDLAGHDVELAVRMIKSKIFTLPDDTVIYCGHGEVSTVSYEKENNDTVK